MHQQGLNKYIIMMEKWKGRSYLVGYKGYRKQAWSFDKVSSRIYALSRKLKHMGLQKQDRVVLRGHLCPQWVVAFFAVLHRGGVVVPVDPECTREFFQNIYQKVSPTLIISETLLQENQGQGENTVQGIPGQGKNSVQKYPGQEKAHTILLSSIDELKGAPEAPSEDISEKDIAEIVFTSGTTSTPKGVVLTHTNILSNLKPLEKALEGRDRLVKFLTPFRILSTIPYSHMFGQAAGIFLPILIGSTIYFCSSTSPPVLLRAIKRDRILCLLTVPRVMKLLMDHVKNQLQTRGRMNSFDRRWDRWVKLPFPVRVLFFLDIHRFLGLHFWAFIVGGAALDNQTHEFWRRLVFAVFQGYGLTETAPIVTMFNPFKDSIDTVGQVLPGQQVKVAEDGEILIKGQNVMSGYYQDPESTSSVLKSGWFRTGDIGYIDENRRLYIKGRKKDMILTSSGHNVFPEDIEKVLNRLADVRESVVLGMPGPSGEAVHAVLLLEEEADPEEVIKKANASLHPHQKIRGYTVWSEPDFPRTSTQKVKKPEVKARITQGQTAAPQEKGRILEEFYSGTAAPDARLQSDLGLDSLDLVEVTSRIEQDHGISIDETLIGPDTTVQEFEHIASRPTPGKTIPMPRWALNSVVRVGRRVMMDGLVLPAMRLFCPVKAHGLNNLDLAGQPAILAANHTSDLDPVPVLLSLPLRRRRLITPALGLNRFYAFFADYGRVARDEKTDDRSRRTPFRRFSLRRLWHRFSYCLITFLFQTYPFPQTTAYRASMEYSGELLDRGYWLLIFPEGRTSPDGTIRKFRGGISAIADNTSAPVVPVGITGMHRVMLPGKRWPRRAKVEVFFGRPLHYTGEDYQEFARKVENKVKAFLQEKSST
ncbi:MAG: AMP-binding protein [Spirochaetota bacterium]